VFSDGGDPNEVESDNGDLAWGRMGSAGRLAGLPKVLRRGPFLSVVSPGFFAPLVKGSRRAISPASLVWGSAAISAGSKGGVWVGAGTRIGSGTSSSGRFAVGSSSPGAKIGTFRSLAVCRLESAIEPMLPFTQKTAKPKTTAATARRNRPDMPITTDLLPSHLPKLR